MGGRGKGLINGARWERATGGGKRVRGREAEGEVRRERETEERREEGGKDREKEGRKEKRKDT